MADAPMTGTIVMARDKDGDKYLVAYYTADIEVEVAALKMKLLETLPAYMIPSHFVRLENFPLTSNGKLNKKALPDPIIISTDDHVPLSGQMEETLAEMWAEILGVSKEAISANSNFFELGGHSLKAAALISRIQKELNVKLRLEFLFKQATIRALSNHLLATSLTKKKQDSLSTLSV
jgi:acyl carrier protein